uniref:Uncharacterized protein LOC104239518 n=1 Tax=Nicotiana sylvestris TaxID=4096 RepID=A0A1U7Y113_NICSY|nr:PREDICTED: uncharacterized protein LOC104239518 [Nicotiana sylvestris]
MAPKKRARLGLGANATLSVAVNHVPDVVGESDSPVLNPPGPSIPDPSIPVPVAAEGATIPPADIPDLDAIPASGPGVSDGDLRGAIHMLTHGQGDSASSRVNQFLRLAPPKFTGTDPEADPQDFLDEMYKTLRVIKATETEGVELASYRLRGATYSWFEMWEDSCGEGRPPARWDEFVDAFMDHFFPAETMAAHATEFEVLNQGSMSVWEYDIEFVRLSKYAPQLVSTMDARVRRFVQGLSPLVVNEAATAATEARKLKIRAERESSSRARSAGHLGRPVSGRGSSQSYAQSSASAPPSVHNYQQNSHLRSGSDSRRPHHSGRPGGRSQQQGRASCPKCGRFQSKTCYLDIQVCYRCGVRGHIQQDCRAPSQGMGRGFAQSSGSSPATSFVHPPALTGRGVVRGGARGRGVPSRVYALSGRQSLEASPDVATGILSVQVIDCYAIIDPGSSLSYVTPFIASSFVVEPEQLHEPFSVSTPVGDSITTTRVYRNCVVMVCGRATTTDLIELEMVDFDVIMGMDWLYSCFSKLDCRTRVMRLKFLNEPVIEWKGNGVVPKGRFISYLKASKMIRKGCIYHLVRVADTTSEVSVPESVPVMNEFLEVFSDELPGIPPDREIDFGIDSREDHADHLREVLQTLYQHQLAGRIMPITSGKFCRPFISTSWKVNVVADALSRKSMGSLAHLGVDQRPLAREVYQLASLGVCISTSNEGKVMVRNGAESSLVAEVKEKQLINPPLA